MATTGSANAYSLTPSFEDQFRQYAMRSDHVAAVRILLEKLNDVPRAVAYASQVNSPEVWAMVGAAQMKATSVPAFPHNSFTANAAPPPPFMPDFGMTAFPAVQQAAQPPFDVFDPFGTQQQHQPQQSQSLPFSPEFAPRAPPPQHNTHQQQRPQQQQQPAHQQQQRVQQELKQQLQQQQQLRQQQQQQQQRTVPQQLTPPAQQRTAVDPAMLRQRSQSFDTNTLAAQPSMFDPFGESTPSAHETSRLLPQTTRSGAPKSSAMPPRDPKLEKSDIMAAFQALKGSQTPPPDAPRSAPAPSANMVEQLKQAFSTAASTTAAAVTTTSAASATSTTQKAAASPQPASVPSVTVSQTEVKSAPKPSSVPAEPSHITSSSVADVSAEDMQTAKNEVLWQVDVLHKAKMRQQQNRLSPSIEKVLAEAPRVLMQYAKLFKEIADTKDGVSAPYYFVQEVARERARLEDQIKRQIEHERTYINTLTQFSTGFLESVNEYFSERSYRSDQHGGLNMMFQTARREINQILANSQKVLKGLMACGTAEHESLICDMFIQPNFAEMDLLYRQYVLDVQLKAKATGAQIDAIRQYRPKGKFAAMCQKSKDLMKMDIVDALTLPMQHFMRYVLLLKDLRPKPPLLALYPESELARIDAVITQMEQANAVLNARTAEREGHHRLVEMAHALGIEKIIKPARSVVFDGKITVDGQLMQAYLCNDLLILAKIGDGSRLTLTHIIRLNDIYEVDQNISDLTGHEFFVGWKARHFCMRADSPALCDLWMGHLISQRESARVGKQSRPGTVNLGTNVMAALEARKSATMSNVSSPQPARMLSASPVPGLDGEDKEPASTQTATKTPSASAAKKDTSPPGKTEAVNQEKTVTEKTGAAAPKNGGMVSELTSLLAARQSQLNKPATQQGQQMPPAPPVTAQQTQTRQDKASKPAVPAVRDTTAPPAAATVTVTPSPAPVTDVTSPVSATESDSVEQSPAARAASPAPPSTPGYARNTHTVIAEYTAQEEGELTLREGDMVVVTDQGADGWWSGTHQGVFGCFPKWCVEAPAQVEALYDFEATAEDELSLTAGEVLSVITETDDWIYGSNEFGQAGNFPASYVQRL